MPENIHNLDKLFVAKKSKLNAEFLPVIFSFSKLIFIKIFEDKISPNKFPLNNCSIIPVISSNNLSQPTAHPLDLLVNYPKTRCRTAGRRRLATYYHRCCATLKEHYYQSHRGKSPPKWSHKKFILGHVRKDMW